MTWTCAGRLAVGLDMRMQYIGKLCLSMQLHLQRGHGAAQRLALGSMSPSQPEVGQYVKKGKIST